MTREFWRCNVQKVLSGECKRPGNSFSLDYYAQMSLEAGDSRPRFAGKIATMTFDSYRNHKLFY